MVGRFKGFGGIFVVEFQENLVSAGMTVGPCSHVVSLSVDGKNAGVVDGLDLGSLSVESVLDR